MREMRMKRWLALFACLLIDGAAVGRVLAQQPAQRAARILNVRSGGYLGVGVEDIDEGRAKVLKLPDARGVEIKGIEPASPAAKVGLAKGDVVLEFNGQRVEGTDQFIRLVRETSPGHKVTLQIFRNGAPLTVVAEVGTRSMSPSLVEPLEGSGNGWNLNLPPMPPMPSMPRGSMQLPLWRFQNGAVVGIEAESLSGQLADYFGVKDGVLVRSVAKNSAAEKGGLKAGDVITRVNGERVTTVGEVLSQVHGLTGKRTVPFLVMRNHHETTMQVTVGDGTQDSDRGESL